VITNRPSMTLGLGFWIVVGTCGCAANGGAASTTNNTQHGTGGGTSSTAHSGGTTHNSQTGGTGVVGTGGTATTQTGGTSSAILTTGGSASTGGRVSTGGSVSSGGKTGVGGTAATGGKGSTNTGGSVATGGGLATGGSVATGGSNATAGSNATGGGSTQSTNCSISVKNASYSTAIGTVGIVTWSTTLPNVDGAQIDFGVDTSYGMTAPVDIKATDYRTVLLGMKQGHAPYHYRITAKSGSTTCTGTDQVFSGNTAAQPNNLKRPTVTTNNKTALYGGFLVLEGFQLNSNGGDYAFILDADGDAVWWYQPSGYGSLSVAKMTYDGKSIWIASPNVPQATAHVGKLTMDGLTFTDYSTQFQNMNHDLAVLPDESVAFIAYGSNGCDDVKLRKPDGTVSTLVNSGKPFGNSNACHCNAIQYDPSDQTLIVSEDDHSGYFKTDLQGTVKWVLNGGTYNSFDKSGGGGTGWTGNHNLHIIGKDHLIIFNNGVAAVGGMPMGSANAVIRELTLNTTAMTTAETWKYEAGISNPVMGDVQRLDNGNTVIVYSTAGTIHEVNSGKTVLQSLIWSGVSSAGTGYFTKRKTLYGAPPR